MAVPEASRGGHDVSGGGLMEDDQGGRSAEVGLLNVCGRNVPFSELNKEVEIILRCNFMLAGWGGECEQYSVI